MNQRAITSAIADSEKDPLVGCFFIVILVVVLVMGIIQGVMLGEKRGREMMKKEAIKRGAAQYNPVTAKFEWKSPVKGEIDE